MLRRADNAAILFQPNFLTGRGWVSLRIGRNEYRVRKMSKEEFRQTSEAQDHEPQAWLRVGDRLYWQFQDRFYWDNDDLSQHEVYALLVTRQQRARRQVDNAVATVAMGTQPRPAQRTDIPDDVKQFVWVRDEGRCRHCGSTAELQFDHVIPVSKGGGNAPANLQILCGPCNRKKSSGLTID